MCRNVLLAEGARRLATGGALLALDVDLDAYPSPADLAAAAARMRAEGWGALTTNSRPHYRDVWALRSRRVELGGLDYDCWNDRQAARARGSCYEVRLPTLDAPSRGGRPGSSTAVIPVDSAFNGLGMYSVDALRGAPKCRYDGAGGCEHVPFHLCLRARGVALGIDVTLVVQLPSGH
jgi:hypothetical protein